MVVHGQTKTDDTVLRAYLGPISGPIGRPSCFFHQVARCESRPSEESTGCLPELEHAGARIIRGVDDRRQPISKGHPLIGDIPGPELSIVPEAGQFVIEDASERVGGLVHEHLGNRARVG
jgi:hypothetical protein